MATQFGVLVLAVLLCSTGVFCSQLETEREINAPLEPTLSSGKGTKSNSDVAPATNLQNAIKQVGKASQATKAIEMSAPASSTMGADGKECSGFGKISVTNKCVCEPGYHGQDCHLHGSVRRYVGSSNCLHGSVVNDRCVCNSGWAGFHCNRRQCVHGKYACAPGTKYCGDGTDKRLPKPVCNCEPGYFGPSCSSTTPPPPPAPVKVNPAPPTKAPCNAMKKCVNTGIFDSDSCSCKCTSPWTGEFCEKCEPRTCMNGMVQDPNSCGCVCPTSKTCAHSGLLDTFTCGCNCTGSWTGGDCNKCDVPPPGKDVCNGHGAFSADDCGCVCMPPWMPETNCKTCSLQADKCVNGAYVASNCSCTCSGLFTGELCDECPTEEELLIKGVDCDGRNFNRKSCACEKTCKPLTCANGGKQNPNTCKCDCNVPNAAAGGAAAGTAAGAAAGNTAALPSGATAAPTTGSVPGAAVFLEASEERSFWSGPTCTICQEPSPSPCLGGKAFNATSCACDTGCERLDCSNGGKFDAQSCTCECPSGWAGKLCEEQATGRSAALAGRSCKALQSGQNNVSSGVYWINPSGKDPKRNAFQAECDFDEDGGGWIRIASIGSKMRMRKITGADYTVGTGALADQEYILKCSLFNGMGKATSGGGGLSNFIVRVSMGAVRDYFRPVAGADLCAMLGSRNKHFWAPQLGGEDSRSGSGSASGSGSGSDPMSLVEEWESSDQLSASSGLRRQAVEEGEGEEEQESGLASMGRRLLSFLGMASTSAKPKIPEGFFKPDYAADAALKDVLGGSAKKWPQSMDGRMYVSFWGGNKGGCCHRSSKLYPGKAGGVDTGTWSQEFAMDLLELSEDAPSPDMDAAARFSQVEQSATPKVEEEIVRPN